MVFNEQALFEEFRLRADSDSPLELIPDPQQQLENGTLRLMFARGGAAVEFIPSSPDELPSLNLVRAGICFDCLGIEQIRERAGRYLAGKRVSIVPDFTFDFDFYMQAVVLDPIKGLCLLAQISTVKMQFSSFWTRPNNPGETLQKLKRNSDDAEREMQITFTIAMSEHLRGVDLSRPVHALRGQALKLLLPQGSPQRKAIDSFWEFMLLDGAASDTQKALQKWTSRCGRLYWLPLAFWRKHSLEKTCASLGAERSALGDEVSTAFKEARGLVPKSAGA